MLQRLKQGPKRGLDIHNRAGKKTGCEDIALLPLLNL
jgi:hypothetical protein